MRRLLVLVALLISASCATAAAPLNSPPLAAFDNAPLAGEANQRLVAVPCESLHNCEQRREVAGGSPASRVALFLICGLGFAGTLVFRIYRPAPASTSVTVAWVLYAAAGVLAIVLSLADPPQTGGGDGMVHGAVGQLLMYALGAPWSLIIAQGHGHDAGTVSGLLMVAVLANIIYGGVHVFLRQRDSEFGP